MQTIIVVPVIVCIFYGKFLDRTNAVCRIWADLCFVRSLSLDRLVCTSYNERKKASVH